MNDFFTGFSAFSDRVGLDYLGGCARLVRQSPLPYALLHSPQQRRRAADIVQRRAPRLPARAQPAVPFLAEEGVPQRGPPPPQDSRAWDCFPGRPVGPAVRSIVQARGGDVVAPAYPASHRRLAARAALWLTAQALPAEERPGRSQALAWAPACGVVVAACVHSKRSSLWRWASALLLVRFPPRTTQARFLAVFAALAAGAWLISFAPWSWHLIREFGNPVLPAVQRVCSSSADYPGREPAPGGLRAAERSATLLLLPLRMATYQEWRFGEKPFADVRPALLVSERRWACAARVGIPPEGRPAKPRPSEPSGCRQAGAGVFFLSGALLWLADVGPQPLRPAAAPAPRRAGLRRAARAGLLPAALRAPDRRRRRSSGRRGQQREVLHAVPVGVGALEPSAISTGRCPRRAAASEPAVYLGFG